LLRTTFRDGQMADITYQRGAKTKLWDQTFQFFFQNMKSVRFWTAW